MTDQPVAGENLPHQVLNSERLNALRMPSMGHRDSYFIGTGVGGASGQPDGVWDFAVGPDYTCPNYLRQEVLGLRMDLRDRGPRFPLPVEMARLRGCGAFSGSGQLEDIRFILTDAALPGSGTLLRAVTLENDSETYTEGIFYAEISPAVERAERGKDSVTLTAREGDWCFGNQENRNPRERRLRITLPRSRCSAFGKAGSPDRGFRLEAPFRLESGEKQTFFVFHRFAESAQAGDFEPLPEGEAYLSEAFRQWGEWLNTGNLCRLPARSRIRDAVESMLVNVKMQQNRDGGMIAGIRRYANSYIRDTHGGMRLLTRTGHLPEVAALLMNIHSRWTLSGYIPNWWSMGDDAFIGNSFHNDASEIPAYYLLMARDYLRYGGDPEVLKNIMPSLRHAAKVQLDCAERQGMLLDFNGDETEKYCVFRDGDRYGLFGHRLAGNRLGFRDGDRSYSATRAAEISVRFFGELTADSDYISAADSLRKVCESAFYDESAHRHSWSRSEEGRSDSLLADFALIPTWLEEGEPSRTDREDIRAVLDTVNPETGYIPLCPGRIEGFCGHTHALALYGAMKAGYREEADRLAETILHSGILGQYGTVSEFYGPGGVPNGHNARPFESGITGEALLTWYLKKQERDTAGAPAEEDR